MLKIIKLFLHGCIKSWEDFCKRESEYYNTDKVFTRPAPTTEAPNSRNPIFKMFTDKDYEKNKNKEISIEIVKGNRDSKIINISKKGEPTQFNIKNPKYKMSEESQNIYDKILKDVNTNSHIQLVGRSDFKGGRKYKTIFLDEVDEVTKYHPSPEFENLYNKKSLERFRNSQLGRPFINPMKEQIKEDFNNPVWNKYLTSKDMFKTEQIKHESLSANWDLPTPKNIYSDMMDGFELLKGIRPIYSERELVIDKIMKEL